jgi:hypothetical protein
MGGRYLLHKGHVRTVVDFEAVGEVADALALAWIEGRGAVSGEPHTDRIGKKCAGMGTQAWGRRHGDAGMGKQAWGRRHGDAGMGMFELTRMGQLRGGVYVNKGLVSGLTDKDGGEEKDRKGD